jgi:hypothetical protein
MVMVIGMKMGVRGMRRNKRGGEKNKESNSGKGRGRS